MITKEGMTIIAEKIDTLLHKIKVVFDDQQIKVIDIHKHEIVDDSIKIMGLLHNEVVGNIVSVDVVDTDGNVILSKPHSFEKSNIYGLLVVFKLRIMEVV